MNVASHRRYSWISLIVAAAVSVGITQSLVAQPSSPAVEAPAAQDAPAQLKTLAVVAGARYEKLLADVTFLGPYLGQPGAGPMAEMNDAIAVSDRQLFRKSYQDMTAMCNACHQATGRPFIVITMPTNPPVFNQRWEPLN